MLDCLKDASKMHIVDYRFSLIYLVLFIVFTIVLHNAIFIVDSALKKYPSKFVGCCLANPAEDGSGIKQLEQLVLKVF